MRKLLRRLEECQDEKRGCGTMERRGKELGKGEEQKRPMCNRKGRKTRKRGISLKDKWSLEQAHLHQVCFLLQGSALYPEGTTGDPICILTLFNKTQGRYS